jgi:hypothetical protein
MSHLNNPKRIHSEEENKTINLEAFYRSNNYIHIQRELTPQEYQKELEKIISDCQDYTVKAYQRKQNFIK